MWKELFGEKLDSKTGDVETETALSGLDAVAIYFSAHWCPPCKHFTPVLAKKYAELKAAGKTFEVVFASSDSDKAAFNGYYGEMPWLALPYDQRALKETLAKKYNCNGIPYLVVLDGKTAEIITTNGRGAVEGKDFIANFPWPPALVPDISLDMDGIDQGKCLIIMQDGAPVEAQKAVEAWITPLAEINKGTKDFGRIFMVNGGQRSSFFRTQLGFETIVPKLPGPMVQYTDFSKAYGHDSWGCDICGKGPEEAVEQWHYKETQCDYCKECYEKSLLPMPESAKGSEFVIVDLSNEGYYKPLEGKTAATPENYAALIADMKADKLTKKALGEK